MKNSLTKFRKCTFYFLLLFLSFASSCNDDDNSSVEDKVYLADEVIEMIVGTQTEVQPFFAGARIPQKQYSWEVSDPSVISVEMNEKNFKGTFTALSQGSSTATIRSTDGSLQASVTFEVDILRETEVTIPDQIDAFTQAETIVTPVFDNDLIFPTQSYNWTASPEGIVEIINIDPETYEITIQGLEEGTTSLTVTSADGLISATTQVTVVDDNDGILKILAIGNSFSEDALESHFYGIATAAGKEVVIGNMYIGGAELALHFENATNNSNSYSYRKIDLEGNKTTSSSVSIASAIEDENWDYISFQQASPKSGQYETFVEPLPGLYNIVNETVTNEYTKYLLHQTWAYAQNSTHSGFPNYNSDQMTMYNAIINAYNQADDLIPTHLVVPAGTAIQNGRTSYLGDNFNRDGYHLNDIGKYTAAATWFEMLTGISVIGNTYMPDGFLEFDLELAQNAAHAAVEKPNEITELSDFQNPGGSGVISNQVFIDFSTSSNSAGWNGMRGFLEGSSIPNLIDSQNEWTGITATVTSRFNGQNGNGESETSTDLNMPSEVSSFSYFGNAGATWAGLDIAMSSVTLSGFTSDAMYDLCFFSSRTGSSGNRETQFTAKGENSATGAVNSVANTDTLVCFEDIQPDENGEILIEITAGPNNDNSNGFFYLNAMRISPN